MRGSGSRGGGGGGGEEDSSSSAQMSGVGLENLSDGHHSNGRSQRWNQIDLFHKYTTTYYPKLTSDFESCFPPSPLAFGADCVYDLPR